MNCVEKIPITKGWSSDKKYRITDAQGTSYLLRISDISRYDRKKSEFTHMQQLAALGVPMCRPMEFGICEEGVYSIQSWIDGLDAEDGLREMDPGEQYACGLEAGRILRQIHAIPAPEDIEPWSVRFNRKIDWYIKKYTDCPLKLEKGEMFLSFIEENRHLLHGRPQCWQHGDYHVGNMMLDRAGKLHIIDFDRDDYGDPWEEFNRMVWHADLPDFGSGIIDGYFLGNVPEEFWRLMALYICCTEISSLSWAISFGEKEVAVMKKQAAEVLSWYDDMNIWIPNWYRK